MANFSYQPNGFLETVGNAQPQENHRPKPIKVEVTEKKLKKKTPTIVQLDKKTLNEITSFKGNPYIPQSPSRNRIKAFLGKFSGSHYQKNRDTDNTANFREDELKESEKQTKLLEEISKNKGVGGNGSSSGFMDKFIAGLGLGAVGKKILGFFGLGGEDSKDTKGTKKSKHRKGKFNLKSLARGGIIGAGVSYFWDDITKRLNSKLEAEAIASGQTIENLDFSKQLSAVVKTVSQLGTDAINYLGESLWSSDFHVDSLDSGIDELSSKLTEKFNNFVDNTGKFGKSLDSAMTSINDELGKVTIEAVKLGERGASYLGDISDRMFDVFRHKSADEKKFIDAQDTIRKRDKFGSLSGVSDKEYRNSVRAMEELAPKLLKNKKFVEDSIYLQTAKDTVDGKIKSYGDHLLKKEKLDKAKEKRSKLLTDIVDAKTLKKDADNGGYYANVKQKFLYSSEQALDAEIKKKEHQLIQQDKFIDEMELSVNKLKKARESIEDKSRPNTVVKGYYSKLGKVESDNNYGAVNELGYTGKYQFSKKTATKYLKELNSTWDEFKKSAEIQEKVVRMFTEDNKKSLEGWGYKADELNLWMAHNLGAYGAKDVLDGNGVSKKTLSNIRGQKGMSETSTVKDYLEYYSKLFTKSTKYSEKHSIDKRSAKELQGATKATQDFYADFRKYAISKGVEPMVTDGVRTAEEQHHIYGSGRTRAGNIVTYKDGFNKKSKHQSGRAMDVASKSYTKEDNYRVALLMREFAKKSGKYKTRFLSKSFDPNHVEVLGYTHKTDSTKPKTKRVTPTKVATQKPIQKPTPPKRTTKIEEPEQKRAEAKKENIDKKRTDKKVAIVEQVKQRNDSDIVKAIKEQTVALSQQNKPQILLTNKSTGKEVSV